MPVKTRAETDAVLDQQARDIAEIKESVKHIETVVITGNGKPALQYRVEKLSDWVSNVNKLALIFLVAAVGVAVPMSCAMGIGVLLLLYQNGLFKIP